MSDAINPLEREGCWLCDGCGEIESTGAIGARETVGCPVCVQNDTEWMMGEKLRKKQEEIDALAARYSALADEVRTMILDSDGLAGYHLNGEVAFWSELEVGHLLAEPDEVGRAVLARLKSRWQVEALEKLAEDLSLDASSAHDNEYHDAGDAMEDAADKALEHAQKLRGQAEGGE